MSDPSKIAVSLRGLTKRYGPVTAVDGIDLDIREGELLTLLGPSGSGKTTTLRLVAGFELPSQGSVQLGGADVTDRPPYERDVNTVFQDYALFPHMSVAGNVDYGLRVRGVPKAERRERVAAALAQVRLDDFGDRRPSQLSGGQRQRIALARALVNRPSSDRWLVAPTSRAGRNGHFGLVAMRERVELAGGRPGERPAGCTNRRRGRPGLDGM